MSLSEECPQSDIQLTEGEVIKLHYQSKITISLNFGYTEHTQVHHHNTYE